MFNFSKLSLKRWKLTAALTVVGLAVVAGVVWAALSFSISAIFNFGPTGGSTSVYLVGYLDTKTDDCITSKCYTNDASLINADVAIYLVNPTPYSLKAYVDIFDDNENSLDCNTYTLSPNKVRRLQLRNDFSFARHKLGMIKIFTEDSAVTTSHKLQAGLKGWLVHNWEFNADGSSSGSGTFDAFSRESPLQEVPVAVLVRAKTGGIPFELDKIVSDCS